MRTALTVLVCLVPCACFDPSTSSNGDTDAATGSDGTSMVTLTTTADPTTGGPVTTDMPVTTDFPETSTTGEMTGSDSTSTTAQGSDSSTTAADSSSEGSTSTGTINDGCQDGLFNGDWPDYGDAQVIDSGRNFQGVKAIDIDGDDDLDLIVVDYSNSLDSAGVFFYEGDGSGNFADPAVLPGSPRYPISVDAAAISDSTPDVVAAVLTPEFDFEARRWRGNGDGTFLNPIEYADPTDTFVKLADVNDDERLDLLGTGEDGVRLRLGNAQEGFGPASVHGAFDANGNPLAADLDGDGNVDVLVASGDGLAILVGDGSGEFPAITQYSLGNSVSRVLIGDFDGDGNADIGGVREAVVRVLPSDGDGGFGEVSELTIQGPSIDVRAADFDGDGCSDIAVLNGSGSVSTIMGRDEFTFTDQHVFPFDQGEAFPYGMDTGDVDNDGIEDVLVVTATGQLLGELLVFRSGG